MALTDRTPSALLFVVISCSGTRGLDLLEFHKAGGMGDGGRISVLVSLLDPIRYDLLTNSLPISCFLPFLFFLCISTK